MYAVVSNPRPPAAPCPLIGVLQIYARDAPDLPFPDGTDLFQLLWCPNDHDEPWYGPRPAAFWRCGQRMTHLVTISSEEFGGHRRWRPDDEPPSSFPRNYAPHGILIGDVGDMYLFTCTACPHRPLDGNSQFT